MLRLTILNGFSAAGGSQELYICLLMCLDCPSNNIPQYHSQELGFKFAFGVSLMCFMRTSRLH